MTTALRIPREILDIEVAELLRATPGYTILGELIAINPRSLGEAGKLDYLAALDRQESWICALKQEALVAIAGEVADETGGIFGAVDDEEREDVATALRLSLPRHKIELMLHEYWSDICPTQYRRWQLVKSQRHMQQLLQRKQQLLFETG
jgi:hypothetical protein